MHFPLHRILQAYQIRLLILPVRHVLRVCVRLAREPDVLSLEERRVVRLDGHVDGFRNTWEE